MSEVTSHQLPFFTEGQKYAIAAGIGVTVSGIAANTAETIVMPEQTERTVLAEQTSERASLLDQQQAQTAAETSVAQHNQDRFEQLSDQHAAFVGSAVVAGLALGVAARHAYRLATGLGYKK